MQSAAFRWNDWNREHGTQHGCSIAEIESVVRSARRAFPRKHGNGKWLVQGRGTGDRVIQVVYLISPPPFVFVIHAMPLTTRRRR